ncbi:MAG: alkylmercury lyase [Acidimicrobiales bacterium]|nr:alkylmercury lyase [Acidimicrobiales bacterium]
MNDLHDLTDALIAAAPVFRGDDQLLARAVYRTLARGKPVTDADLATTTELPIDQVQAVLAGWPGVFRNADNNIVGFWGLALLEMPHALTVDGAELYAWCAWDTLFLPAVLKATAEVHSADPSSGEPVTLIVTPNEVKERSHERIAVSFLSPGSPFEAGVIESFCHYVHFFTDPESAAPWVSSHDGTFLIGLDDAFQLGQRWNAARGFE